MHICRRLQKVMGYKEGCANAGVSPEYGQQLALQAALH